MFDGTNAPLVMAAPPPGTRSAFLAVCAAGDPGTAVPALAALKASVTTKRQAAAVSEAVNAAFLAACGDGHLDLAKWLYNDVGGVNVHADNDDAFVDACGNGHLDVAKWLYNDVGGVNVQGYHDAFQSACKGGHLAVARWLHDDLCGVDVHADLHRALRYACAYEHPALALWLDSDEIWNAVAGRERPVQCEEYLQAVRWSELRSQWISVVACGKPMMAPRPKEKWPV